MFDFYRFLMKQLGMYAPWSLKGATDNFHFYMTFIFNLKFCWNAEYACLCICEVKVFYVMQRG